METVLPGRTHDQPWQDFTLIERAWALSAELHRDQFRKARNVPYVSHLWSVAALVLEHGGDDRQVAAALLHDAAEDQGGIAVLERIASELGDDVAGLVRLLSDSLADTTSGEDKERWDERKQRYIDGIGEADDRVLLISACDKLHNLRSLLTDHRELGDTVWSHFTKSDPSVHVWYYGSLVAAFRGRIPPALEADLELVLAQLVELAAVARRSE
ncbi:MAG: HD domain-containing protein [Actinobacteria bacterium]|nr:HD domain-containing protein [Actinomycetota bacterium]